MDLPQFTNHCYHPNHEVRVERDPDHGDEERERIPVLVLLRAAVRHRFAAQIVDGVHQRPSDCCVQAGV